MTVNDRNGDVPSPAPALAASSTTIAVVAGRGRTDAGTMVLAAYDAHHRELANFVRGIERDRDAADDVVSETFVKRGCFTARACSR